MTHDEKLQRFRALCSKYEAASERALRAEPIDAVRAQILHALDGWPQRLYCKGGVKLFVDCGGDEVSEFSDAKDFFAWLKEYTQVGFFPGMDYEGVNFVTQDELYKSFGRAPEVQEWRSVDAAPHWPPYPGHYVTWSAPADYTPTGAALAEFIKLFNLVTPTDRALFAAEVLTPFWGGPYDERPCFVHHADQPESGKTKAASLVGELACPKLGALMVNLDRRSEERIKERLLSPEGRLKSVAVVDNVKGVVDCGLLEELITTRWISGKELSVGESSRPNTVTWIITANNAKLSTDLQSRAYGIKFGALQNISGDTSARWIERVHGFMERKRHHVVADCIHVLQGTYATEWMREIMGARGSLWIKRVLGAALAHPVVAEAVGSAPGVKILDVIRSNQAWRDESNEDLQESEMFMQGLLERVVKWKDYRLAGNLGATGHVLPKKDIFIRTEPPPKVDYGDDVDLNRDQREQANNNMVEYWREIFTRKDISSKWLVGKLKEHIGAGRLKGLRFKHTERGNGWVLSCEVVAEYVAGGSKEIMSEWRASLKG